MRINQFIARASGLSRRAADAAIASGRVRVNDKPATLGQEVIIEDAVMLDGQTLSLPSQLVTIMLNKPAGYVVSRSGQGSKTIYDLLPSELHNLKPVGRLDKDSSGLLLLTNDGQLAQELTHPKFTKAKVYEVELDKSLTPANQAKIEQGIELEDGLSRMKLTGDGKIWVVKMSEGRNRQIRRTFGALGYTVTKLHRNQFDNYRLDSVQAGQYLQI